MSGIFRGIIYWSIIFLVFLHIGATGIFHRLTRPFIPVLDILIKLFLLPFIVVYIIVIRLPYLISTIIGIGAVVLIYTLSILIPPLGYLDINRYLQKIMEVSVGENRIESARDSLVTVIDEVSPDIDPENLPDDPQEQFEKTRRQARERLDRGESVFSIFAGILLLYSYYVEDLPKYLSILNSQTIVELFLIILTLGVIYRSVILEMVAYRGNEELGPPSKQHAALTFQKAICQRQILPFLLVIVAILVRGDSDKMEVAQEALIARYRQDLSIIATMRIGFRLWINRKLGWGKLGEL